MRQAAAFHLKGGEPEKAAGCLEQLWKLDPSDTATLARLVLLYSQVKFIFVATDEFILPQLFPKQFDPATAQKRSQLLPPLELDAGVSALDVDALESATWALGLKHARKGPPTGGPT